MPTRRTLLVQIPSALLTYGLMARAGRAAEFEETAAWSGEFVRRASPEERVQFASGLRDVFKQTRGAAVSTVLIPDVGRSLFEQFAAVDYGFAMDLLMLPNNRLIFNRYDPKSGVNAIIVPGTDGATITATAFLTNLCPKEGVDEDFVMPNGLAFQQHLLRQLDYNLLIYYASGSNPDHDLNADLLRWALAAIRTRHSFIVPYRKLLLRRAVRILRN